MSASRGAPDVYAITDRRSMTAGFAETVDAAFAAGLRWLQVREKDLAAGELLALVRSAVASARRHGARVLVNDRADVALAAGADGVHLPEGGLDAGAVRAGFPGLLVGASVHSLERAREQAAAGVDFILFGPVFATPSKAAYGAPLGVAELGRVTAGLSVPVVAVGGVGRDEVRACLEAGAAGVAAIRGLLGVPDVGQAVREFLREVRVGKGMRGA